MRLLHPTMRASRGAPDNPWRVLCEAQAEQRSDVLKTRADLQTADTFTARSHDFPSANVLDAVNETCEVTLANAPAGNHLYEAHYRVSIDPVIPGAGTNTHKVVVAIETDLTGGGSWVEYWTAEYELITKVGEPDRVVEWKSERLTARVPSLTSSSKLRLKVKAASGPGGWTFQVHGFNLATDGDLLSGVTYHTGPAFDFNENGGGAELADTVVTKLSHGSHDQFETDLGGPPLIPDVSPFIVARTVWGSADSADLVIDRFTAHLHPKENAGNPKDVAWFVCQPYALQQVGGPPLNPFSLTEHLVSLLPLSYPVYVPAGDGTSAQDYVFTWHDRDIKGGKGIIIGTERKPRPKSVVPNVTLHPTEYDHSPTTFWFIWALKADFTPASNVGWARDSGTTEVVSSTRKLRTVQIRKDGSAWAVEAPTSQGATARPVFRCKIECGSYTNANLEYTGSNLIDLGATPTETVEFVAVDTVPAGCQGIFEVRNNADTDWLPFKDGQTAAEVGVSQRQTYKVRYRALTNSQGDASPVLFEIGVRDLKRVWLGDISDRITGRWHIPDVAELIPALPEIKIRILRTGDADDFNDRITKLFAEHYSSALAFRLWVGDPARPRNEWHHKDDCSLVDDYEPAKAYIDIVAHSPAVLLRELALPVYNVTTEKREALTLANRTPRQLWAEIITTQLGADIPGRFRGEGFLDDSTLLSKTITDSDGKTELDAIGHIAGAVVSSDAGKIRAFDMFTPGSIRAFFPSDEITWRSTTPGLRQRVPEFFVLYDYREETQKYEGEARIINGTALLNLKTRGLDAPTTLRDAVCRWIPTETTARDVGRRRTDTIGGGMLVWTFTSTKPYPELRFGDLIAVETDRFVARDPTQTTLRQIKGQRWVIGRVIDYDIEGRELGIWIQSWSDFLGTAEVGVRTGLVAPEIQTVKPVWRGNRLFIQWTGIPGVGSSKIATSTSAYQADGTGTSQNGSENIFDAGTFNFGDTVFVTVTPYAATGAGGRQGPSYRFRGRLGWVHGMFDDSTGKPKRDQDFTDAGFALKGTDNTGETAHTNVKESGGKAVNRLFAKPLAADPDHLDSVGDGSTYARILGNRLTTGAIKRAGAFDDGSYALLASATDGLTAGSGVKESGAKNINRLLAKVLAGDADSLDGTPDGTTFKRVVSVGSDGKATNSSLKLTKTVVILQSGSSWNVPADFNPFLNSIELIGGGGSGAPGVTNSSAGGGGGGGEYRRLVNFDPAGLSSVSYAIGGGSSSSSPGGDTSWNSGMVIAKGGSSSSTATGAAGGTGGTGGEGKNGGTGGNGVAGTGDRAGGGGGGAGGPHGVGGNGSNASGGVGGAGGAGGPPNGGTGGAGGAPGTAGGDGTTWTTAGPGGGGGGGSNGANNGGVGGNDGGGGGGSGSSAVAAGSRRAGQDGVIVISYYAITNN